MPIVGRKNPYRKFRFLIELEGLIVGGFSEVSGLQAGTEVETIEEGGVNNYVHKLPKKQDIQTSFSKRHNRFG